MVWVTWSLEGAGGLRCFCSLFLIFETERLQGTAAGANTNNKYTRIRDTIDSSNSFRSLMVLTVEKSRSHGSVMLLYSAIS